MNRVGRWASLLMLLAVMIGACRQPDARSGPEAASRLSIELDNTNPERLLRYYFGGYLGPDGGDPFDSGLLIREGDQFFIDVNALDALHPGAKAALQGAAGDRRLEWEELASFLNASYYGVRALPATLEALRTGVPYLEADSGWFRVDIDGVMTTARRHVYVAEAALRYALRGYQEQGERLIYPEGTVIVGEHYDGETFVEATVIRKRSDGFWDFFTYGADGALASQTQPLPRSLKTPTQCVGCHFGAKQFDPEKSYPAEAPPGPHGPRAFYIDDSLRDGDAAVFFDEHRKRSDTVLGIYNTLFVARLRAERRDGHLAAEDAKLLDDLGL